MSRRRRMSAAEHTAIKRADQATTRTPWSVEAQFAAGEVHFLWWFIQGSIMDLETRHRLWHAWGMCERHSFGWLSVEAAFRHCYLHSPAIVYAELMARASRAFEVSGPLAGERLARRLRMRGPCLMCDLELGPDSAGGFIAAERVAEGRDLTQLRRFMAESEQHWRGTVCGHCDRTAAPPRCRRHLLLDLAGDSAIDIAAHRALVKQIAVRAERYSMSYRWERRGTDTAEDRAALVSAVGWCSGWNALLSVL